MSWSCERTWQVNGAAALQRQGFLDAAQEILLQYRGSAGSEAAAAIAEAELRIALAQASCHIPLLGPAPNAMCHARPVASQNLIDPIKASSARLGVMVQSWHLGLA